MRSLENPTGVLTKGETEYLDCVTCLEVDKGKLGELFVQDEAHWTLNLEQIKSQAEDIQNQIKEFLAKQRLDFEDMMRKSMS